MPQELGLETHAVLYDAEQHPDHVLATGQGGDEAEALLDLVGDAPGTRGISGRDRTRR